MKKRILIVLSAIAIVMTMFGVTACGGKSEAFLTPAASASVKIDETNKTMTVEAGVTSSIPQAAVTDKEGNILSDYVVTRLVTKPDGTKSPATVTLNHGDELTVKYTAVKGKETLEKTYSLKCYDTIPPTLTFLNLSRTYAEGATITIGFTDVSADLDRANSTVTLRNVTADTTENISLDAGCEFIATAGEYTLIASLKDISGNENTIEKSFKVVAPFVDEDVDDHCIWDFNEEGYIASVAFAADGDTADTAIVDDTDGETPVRALKIPAKAGKTYNVTFSKGATLRIYEQEAISFRVKADRIVDIFEVYNADDGTMYDLSWKTGGYDGYITAYAPISALFNEGYELGSLRVKISTEVDTDIYIDYIGYTDPAPIFTDDDLPENMLAAFDEAGYLERISAASGKDHTTFNASWSYEEAESCPAGSTDGAIKFVSSTDPATTSDKQARDGFTYRFNKRLKASDFKNLAFRVYCEGEFGTLSLSFNDRKKGDTVYLWVAGALGVKNEWITVRVPADQLAETVKGCENIVSVCVRFHRPATSPAGAALYLDGISNIEAGYADYNYDFGSLDDPDFYAARAIDGGTVIGMVADSAAKDGYALKAVTAYGAKSGVKINFNDVDVSGYSEVRVRLRTANPSNASQAAAGIYLNGSASPCKYGAFGTYTTIDLKQHLDGNTLSSIEFARQTVKGVEIYIDSITFVRPTDYSQVNYDFSGEDDYDLTTANEYNGGEVEGIVADGAATDGYALKGSTANTDDSGIRIFFDNIRVDDYAAIYLRLRTTNSVSISVNGMGSKFGAYNTYTEYDISAVAKSNSIEYLTSIEIFRTKLPLDIYVDSIIFEEKPDYSKINYDFSAADDYDLKIVSGYNGGTVSGIVADTAATDGYALKGSTVRNGGVKIAFNDLIIADYVSIRLRIRTYRSSNPQVTVSMNGGKSLKWSGFADYTDVDIIELFNAKKAAEPATYNDTVLSSIEIWRDSVADIEIYVDSITLVKWSEINYDFSSADDIDMTVVSGQGDGKDIGMVADEKATDGFALKAVTGNNGGVKIAFNNLDISEYETITLRIRTESTAASPQINVNVNDTSNNLEWKKYDEYTEIELVAAMKNKNINTLSSILLYRNVPNTTIYVDSVTLVKKTA